MKVKKIERCSKSQIIDYICHYDSYFVSLRSYLLKCKKNFLINIYFFVLLNYISSSVVDCFSSCLFAKEFLND